MSCDIGVCCCCLLLLVCLLMWWLGWVLLVVHLARIHRMPGGFPWTVVCCSHPTAMKQPQQTTCLEWFTLTQSTQEPQAMQSCTKPVTQQLNAATPQCQQSPGTSWHCQELAAWIHLQRSHCTTAVGPPCIPMNSNGPCSPLRPAISSLQKLLGVFGRSQVRVQPSNGLLEWLAKCLVSHSQVS